MRSMIRLVAVWVVGWQSLALAQLDAPTTQSTNVSDAKPVAAVTPPNATEPEHALLPAKKKVRGFNKRVRGRGHGLEGELPTKGSKGGTFLSRTGSIRSVTGGASSSSSKGGSKRSSEGKGSAASKGATANADNGNTVTTNNTVDNSEDERSSGVVSKCAESVANATLVTGRTRITTYQMELHVIASAGEAGSMRYKLRSALQRQVAPYLTSCEAPLRTNTTRARRLQSHRFLLNGVMNVVFGPLQVKDIRTYSDRRRVVLRRGVADRSPSIRADLLLLLPQGTVRIRRG
jgi:hypothetical protein